MSESGKDAAGSPGREVLDGTPPPADWRRYARFTTWGVVAVIVLIFLVNNSEPTEVSFVFFKVQLSLWIVLLGMLIIGFGLGWSASWWRRRRRRKRDGR